MLLPTIPSLWLGPKSFHHFCFIPIHSACLALFTLFQNIFLNYHQNCSAFSLLLLIVTCFSDYILSNYILFSFLSQSYTCHGHSLDWPGYIDLCWPTCFYQLRISYIVFSTNREGTDDSISLTYISAIFGVFC